MTTSNREPLPLAALLGSVTALAALCGAADALLLLLVPQAAPTPLGALGLVSFSLAVLDGLAGIVLALLAGLLLLVLQRFPLLLRLLPDVVFSAFGFGAAAALGLALIRPTAWEAVDKRLLLMAGLLMAGLLALRSSLGRPQRDRLFAGATVLFGTSLVVITGFALLISRPLQDLQIERAIVVTSLTGPLLSGLLRRASDGDADGWPTVLCGPDCDCNDREPGIHPAAVDRVGDGTDSDCDGRDGQRTLPLPGSVGHDRPGGGSALRDLHPMDPLMGAARPCPLAVGHAR